MLISFFFFFAASLGTNDHNCPPSIFSPSGFFQSNAAAGYNLNHWSQLCKWTYPRLTNDLLSQLTFVYRMQITSRFRNMPENVKTLSDWHYTTTKTCPTPFHLTWESANQRREIANPRYARPVNGSDMHFTSPRLCSVAKLDIKFRLRLTLTFVLQKVSIPLDLIYQVSLSHRLSVQPPPFTTTVKRPPPPLVQRWKRLCLISCMVYLGSVGPGCLSGFKQGDGRSETLKL